MRKLINAALAAFLFAAAAPVLPAAASEWPASSIKVVTLLASAARTATGTGSWVATGTATLPISGITFGVNRAAQVFLNVTVATSGTLDLTIEGTTDGGTTTCTLTPSSAWTQVTTSTGKQVRRYEGPLPPQIRALGTGASTPIHTYSVTAWLAG